MRLDRPAPLSVVTSGGAVHLLLLCAPMLLLADSQSALADVRVALFLALATAWYMCESTAQPARLAAHTTARPAWLPLAGGVAVLLTFWTSLIGRSGTSVALHHGLAFGWPGLEGEARNPGALFASLSPAPANLTRILSFDEILAHLGVSVFAGTGLMLLGLVLRRSAIRALGRYFLNEIALLPDQPLITHGVYRLLRHPSETGTLCLAAGAALLLASPPGLLACLFLVLPYVLLRTHWEDRLLAQRHASAFATYARAVPALLPRFGFTRRGR